MFLIDDLLAAPFRGMLFVLREVVKAAEEEQENRKHAIMAELSDLHRALDGGQLSSEAFDEKEAALLEELDRLRGTEPDNDNAAG